MVDIETTGGLKGGNRITEIGIVKVQHGKVIDTWTTLINPQRHIPSFITKLTGISDGMVYNAPVFADIAQPLLDKLAGSIFVAHNVNFDYGFIKKECEVGNLSAHFNLNLTSHHRALADATATAELLLLIQNSETLTQ